MTVRELEAAMPVRELNQRIVLANLRVREAERAQPMRVRSPRRRV